MSDDLPAADGPYQPFTDLRLSCDAAHHSGHSLQSQNQMVDEFTVYGLSRLSPHLRESPVRVRRTPCFSALRCPDLESFREVKNKRIERFAEPVEEIPDDEAQYRQPLR
jgi:hypothetical protein